MMMNRVAMLRLRREKVLTNLADQNGSRAKLLTILMDIDDEIEELERNKINA
ncbi:MAG TPA: hypothetical protein VN456_11585 [Desulfosporosinus sp.]|nr:hypothetical protein [Desulfosporosinus sp.]